MTLSDQTATLALGMARTTPNTGNYVRSSESYGRWAERRVRHFALPPRKSGDGWFTLKELGRARRYIAELNKAYGK